MNKASSVAFLAIMALGVCVLCGDCAFAQGSEDKEPVRTHEEADDWLDGFEEETNQEAGTGPGERDEFLDGFEEGADEDGVQVGVEDEKPSSWSLDGEVYLYDHVQFFPGCFAPVVRVLHGAARVRGDGEEEVFRCVAGPGERRGFL